MKKLSWNHELESFTDYMRRCWTLELLKEVHHAIFYYKLAIPVPMLSLNDDSQHLGIFNSNNYVINISSVLIKNHSWDVVIEVLKHELAHALVSQQGGDHELPHGPLFQKACQRLGVAPWARHAIIEIDPKTALSEHRQLPAEEARMLQKVEKLLSLASSSNEHEAALAMQRARELCARHHLESLLARKKTNYTYVVINHRKRQIPAFQWAILRILNTHFYVKSISRSLFDAEENIQHRCIDIMGTLENVQLAEYVYWFLYNQLPLLFGQFQIETKKVARNARNSFYLGVLKGFSEKLAAQQKDLKTKSKEWGLVALDSDRLSLEALSKNELNAFFDNRYPSTTSSGGRQLQISEEAFSSGKAQGRELNLHRGLHEQHSGLVHQLK